MIRLACEDIASNKGLWSLSLKVANAHAVLDRPCAPKRLMVAIAAEESASSSGRSRKGSLATAQTVLPMFCWSKSPILLMAEAAIDSTRGPEVLISREAHAHAGLDRSWLLHDLKIGMACAEIACISGMSSNISAAKDQAVFDRFCARNSVILRID